MAIVQAALGSLLEDTAWLETGLVVTRGALDQMTCPAKVQELRFLIDEQLKGIVMRLIARTEEDEDGDWEDEQD